MKKIDMVFIFLGLLLGLLCFLGTSNYLFSFLVIVIFIADYFVLMRKRFIHYFSLIDRVHTSYHFINSFIITLSVKDSLDDAYQNGIRINDYYLNEETKALEEMPIIDRIKYLKGFFKLSIYNVFLNVIDLHQDQGGNILNMSENLLRESTRVEKTLSDTRAIGFRHLTQFLILWVMAVAILLFLRFSLKDFYLMMLKMRIIGVLIFVFFLLCILSINLFVNVFTNLTVKEEKDDK